MKFSEFRKSQGIRHTAYSSVAEGLRITRNAIMVTDRKEAAKECGRAVEVVELGIRREPSKLLRNLAGVTLPVFRQIKKIMER